MSGSTTFGCRANANCHPEERAGRRAGSGGKRRAGFDAADPAAAAEARDWFRSPFEIVRTCAGPDSIRSFRRCVRVRSMCCARPTFAAF